MRTKVEYNDRSVIILAYPIGERTVSVQGFYEDVVEEPDSEGKTAFEAREFNVTKGKENDEATLKKCSLIYIGNLKKYDTGNY